jgi:hypothetical protein
MELVSPKNVLPQNQKQRERKKSVSQKRGKNKK